MRIHKAFNRINNDHHLSLLARAAITLPQLLLIAFIRMIFTIFSLLSFFLALKLSSFQSFINIYSFIFLLASCFCIIIGAKNKNIFFNDRKRKY
jgi:hypothetical protein